MDKVKKSCQCVIRHYKRPIVLNESLGCDGAFCRSQLKVQYSSEFCKPFYIILLKIFWLTRVSFHCIKNFLPSFLVEVLIFRICLSHFLTCIFCGCWKCKVSSSLNFFHYICSLSWDTVGDWDSHISVAED
jgi:hypothetical protein